MIGIGVVGYGYWGPNLVRNFASTVGAQVIAICDMDSSKLDRGKRLYPSVVITKSFRDLLTDSRIDAIAIATPVSTHYELALAALKAGKHVLVEKPLAQTSEAGSPSHRRGGATKTHSDGGPHVSVHARGAKNSRSDRSKESLGEIYYYNGIRASLGLFQSDVNVIWDLAVHDVSIIQYILNEAPVAVSATGASHVAGAPENMAHLALFFQNSCIAHVSVNWLSPVKLRQTFIGGSRKMIVYDDVEATDKIKVYDKGITVTGTAEAAHQLKIGYRAGDMWAPHLPAKEALQTEIEHFVDCVCTGACPISNGITGLQVVRILEAASRSIQAQGNPVRLGSEPHALTGLTNRFSLVSGLEQTVA